MKNGTVKFFNASKGFGFIIVDEDDSEIFFHIKQVKGGKILKENDRVQFTTENSKKGLCAVDVETL